MSNHFQQLVYFVWVSPEHSTHNMSGQSCDHTFAINLAVVFSDTTCKNMVDGYTNAMRVPIVAPVSASTNSTKKYEIIRLKHYKIINREINANYN